MTFFQEEGSSVRTRSLILHLIGDSCNIRFQCWGVSGQKIIKVDQLRAQAAVEKCHLGLRQFARINAAQYRDNTLGTGQQHTLRNWERGSWR